MCSLRTCPRTRRDDFGVAFRCPSPHVRDADEGAFIEAEQESRPAQLVVIKPFSRAEHAIVVTLGERLDSRIVDLEADAVERREGVVHTEIGHDPVERPVTFKVN